GLRPVTAWVPVLPTRIPDPATAFCSIAAPTGERQMFAVHTTRMSAAFTPLLPLEASPSFLLGHHDSRVPVSCREHAAGDHPGHVRSLQPTPRYPEHHTTCADIRCRAPPSLVTSQR